MQITKLQPTKENKAEKPKAWGLKISAPHFNNFKRSERAQKKKKKDQRNQDRHHDQQNR